VPAAADLSIHDRVSIHDRPPRVPIVASAPAASEQTGWPMIEALVP
jgi:hypothetical protein